MAEMITVSGLNRYVRSLLDSDRFLSGIAIKGEIANYTDRYAITTCDDNQSVCVALNISQMLQKKWQSDTDRQRGFRLEADGKAYSLSGKRVYTGWSLCNCDLVLAQEVGNDTLAVLELSPDSLVLQGRKGGEIEVFHSI